MSAPTRLPEFTLARFGVTSNRFAAGSARYASAAGTPIMSIPDDQAYFWTAAWQRDEAIADHQIATGQTTRYSSPAEAAAALLED